MDEDLLQVEPVLLRMHVLLGIYLVERMKYL